MSKQLQAAMETLNSQWYLAVSKAIGLQTTGDSAFQLYQGNSPLGDTSVEMWNIMDSVPPASVAHMYNPSQRNLFSQQYGSVIYSLNSAGLAKLQQDLGDYYSPFMDAWQQVPMSDPITMEEFFKKWSSKFAPDLQAVGVGDINAMSNDPVVVAQNAWQAAGGMTAQHAYNQTIDNVTGKIQGTPSKSCSLNSATDSSDVSHTWAQGSVGGAYDFFSASASAKYDQLSEKYVSANLSANVTFEHQVTIAMGPLASTSTNPILKQYKPWYVSPVLTAAYNTKDNTMWKTGSPYNWNNTFGPTGGLARSASALVVVDGISLTMTSEASLSTAEQQSFETQASVGFWPFFSASGSGGWSTSTSFNDQGQATITSKSANGNPQVLGILMTPAPQYLS